MIQSQSGVSAHQIGKRQQIGDAHQLLLRKMYNCKADFPKIRCKDKKRECKNWAKNGLCQQNPEYMRPHCRNSCGLCDPFWPQRTHKQVSARPGRFNPGKGRGRQVLAKK